MATDWTNGDVSGSDTLTDNDHLYPGHINELRVAVNAAENDIDTLEGDIAAVEADIVTLENSLNTAIGTGWTGAGETWVYVSATTFKIVGVDVSVKYPKGTRLRFKQGGGYKYAVTTTDASFATDTTVTILNNTDYSIANAVITDNDYSYQASPQGYPTYFNFSTTITNQGGAFTNNPTVNYAKIAIIGRIATVAVKWTYHATSGGSGSIRVSLPVTPAQDGTGFGVEVTNIIALAVIVDSANTRFTVQEYDGTTPISNNFVDLVQGEFGI